MSNHAPWALTSSLAGLSLLPAIFMLQVESFAQSSASDLDDYSHAAVRDWPMVGGDWSNARYSALDQINTQNVRQLGAAWVSKTFEEGSTSKVTPVVKDGRMFVTAGRYVYALNAKTGKTLWTYNTVLGVRSSDFTLPTEKAAEIARPWGASPNWKGVGVGEGLVFVGLMDGHVIALKQETGDLIWKRQTGIDQPKEGQWAAVAPTYSNGIVFTGLSDGDHNQRGRSTGLDASTGKQIWQMFTVPGPGEPGHQTWPSFNDAWKFGGGGVWTNPPVDAELGLAYFTSGNPVPAYGGDWRPGANLYTCSVIAVDIKTGRLRWYYQLIHHDVFEADLGTPVVLYNIQISGKARKALAVLRADGHVFLLDRETGQPLLPVEERPVPQLASQKTSPTQPFPIGGESILMSCEDWKKERIPAGFVLGCMFTPAASPPPTKDPQNVLAPAPAKGSLMAYSPQTGYFYAQGISKLHWPRRSQDPYFLNWVGVVPGLREYGELAAIDGRTGKIAWKTRMPATSLGGSPLATAGGLIFRSSGDGAVEGHDAKIGDVLWQFQTGMGNGGPPASYEVDAEQYVALSVGPAIWAFKLGGSASTAQVPAVSAEEEDFSGPLVDTHKIETTFLHHSLIGPGTRYFIDEFTFNPPRARVEAETKVLFVNNGVLRHEIVAVDKSWGTGPLSASQETWVTFDKPGRYTYVCKEHPWSYGQVVVTAGNSPLVNPETSNTTGVNTQVNASTFAEQALAGREQFNENCSICHGEGASGQAAALPLFGTIFKFRWRGAAVMDLFDKIRTTMPLASPGSLDRQAYLDIVAYLLRANDLPSPKDKLSDYSETLKNMKIAKEEI